jgi:hypothetical protein
MAKQQKGDGMPELTGTPRQVAWAMELRKTFIDKQLMSAGKMDPDEVSACLSALQTQSDATFFIDNRKDLAAALLGDTDGEASGLPELTGTEKQVAWAERIRKSFVAGLDAAAKKRLMPEIVETEQASWWIDHRDNIAASFAKEAGSTLALPEIQGSEKQVTWAVRIREQFVATLSAEDEQELGEAIGRLDQARFWIDHREDLRAGLEKELEEPGSTSEGSGRYSGVTE